MGKEVGMFISFYGLISKRFGWSLFGVGRGVHFGKV